MTPGVESSLLHQLTGISVAGSADLARRRRNDKGRAMGAAARQITAKSSLAFLRDVFRERCEARAILVDAYLLDLQEAVDGLQQAARNYDLIAAFGADHVQAVMAAAFGFRQTQNKPWDEPAPRKFTPKEKAYWEKRFAGSFKASCRHPVLTWRPQRSTPLNT